MKNLFKILIVLPFLIVHPLSLHAQETEEIANSETEEVVLEEEANEEEKESISLLEKLEKEEQEIVDEDFTNPTMSFLTILAAILIPSIFIIICYFIFKFFKF